MRLHDCTFLTLIGDAFLIGVSEVGFAYLITVLRKLDLLADCACENIAGFRLGLLSEEHLCHLTGRAHRPIVTEAGMLQCVPAFLDDTVSVHEINIERVELFAKLKVGVATSSGEAVYLADIDG